jgi:hypothetical protein
MTAINRCAVGIGPRQPLIDWIRQVSGEHEVRWGANEDGLYLLPVYEDDSEAIVVLEECYDWILDAAPPFLPPHRRGVVRDRKREIIVPAHQQEGDHTHAQPGFS